MSRYGGNTVFYDKAEKSTLTLLDVFSDVFKKHNKLDGERLFMAGTSTTTPDESRMLQEWRKPWVFFRVLLVCLAFWLMFEIMNAMGYGVFTLIPLIFVQASIVPVTILLFYWEMNIPRNIPIYKVLILFFIGGPLSLIITGILNAAVPMDESQVQFAAFIEEPAKLAVACIFLRRSKYRYTLNGILIGGGIGCGFAIFETIGYGLMYLFSGYGFSDTLFARGILAPGGHVLYAAIYVGILAGIKGADKLRLRHFAHPSFLGFFAFSIVLHYIWNDYVISIFPVPVIGDVKYVLIIAVGWLVLLAVIKRGIREVLSATAQAQNTTAEAQTHGYCLYGVSGLYAQKTIPLCAGKIVLGRNQAACNLVFPADASGISRQHCMVAFDGQNVWLTDNNSRNGTFLGNGERLQAGVVARLEPGQRFYLGTAGTMFELRKQ